MARVTAQSSCEVAGDDDLFHIRFGNDLVPRRVQNEPLDVGAKPRDVGTDAVGDKARGAGVDRHAFLRHALFHPLRRLDRVGRASAVDDGGFRSSCLVSERRLSTASATITRQQVSTGAFT